MLIQIDTHGGEPIYRQIMDQVTRMIVAGQLATGEQLESVSGLAARLRVNPMTVSKAYGYLVESGLVERRPGVGLFVLPVDGARKREVRRRLLVDAMSRAASLSVQLGMDEEAAVRLLRDEFLKLEPEKERKRS